MTRLPAEWENQSFIQFTFPHVNSDWAETIEEVTSCYTEIICKASKYQDILIICDDIERVKKYFPHNSRIFYAQVESNDTWTRDHGGITIEKNNKKVILDYVFNGWGLKFAANFDNQITSKLFSDNILKNCDYQLMNLVLEGGSIESDGLGTILTTTKCLTSFNRNPAYDIESLENKLKNQLGAKKTLWLDYGFLEGDDTDSHIDTLARFCDKNTIVYTGCNNPKDVHYNELQKMKSQLSTFTSADNIPYNLVELPLPDPCYSKGERLPATYANFTIINNAVLLPLYGVDQDKDALDIIKKCFPEREVIGINCKALIEQHGSLHCITMNYPKGVELNKEILTK